jgi:hypothetical protein
MAEGILKVSSNRDISLALQELKLSQNQRFHSLHDLHVQYTMAMICLEYLLTLIYIYARNLN